MAWIRRQEPLLLIFVLGMAVALATFYVTSQRALDAPADFDYQNASGRPGGIHLGPYAQDVHLSGFDPWTGQPHAWSYTEHPHGIGTPVTTVGPVPDDLAGRWAVALPIGFGIGALAGLALVMAARRRLRPAGD